MTSSPNVFRFYRSTRTIGRPLNVSGVNDKEKRKRQAVLLKLDAAMCSKNVNRLKVAIHSTERALGRGHGALTPAREALAILERRDRAQAALIGVTAQVSNRLCVAPLDELKLIKGLLDDALEAATLERIPYELLASAEAWGYRLAAKIQLVEKRGGRHFDGCSRPPHGLCPFCKGCAWEPEEGPMESEEIWYLTAEQANSGARGSATPSPRSTHTGLSGSPSAGFDDDGGGERGPRSPTRAGSPRPSPSLSLDLDFDGPRSGGGAGGGDGEGRREHSTKVGKADSSRSTRSHLSSPSRGGGASPKAKPPRRTASAASSAASSPKAVAASPSLGSRLGTQRSVAFAADASTRKAPSPKAGAKAGAKAPAAVGRSPSETSTASSEKGRPGGDASPPAKVPAAVGRSPSETSTASSEKGAPGGDASPPAKALAAVGRSPSETSTASSEKGRPGGDASPPAQATPGGLLGPASTAIDDALVDKEETDYKGPAPESLASLAMMV